MSTVMLESTAKTHVSVPNFLVLNFKKFSLSFYILDSEN